MSMAKANEMMVKTRSQPWAWIEEVAPSPLLYPQKKSSSSSSSPNSNSPKLETIREDRAEECDDDADDDPITYNNTIPISAFSAGSRRSSFSSLKKCSNCFCGSASFSV